MNAIRPPAVAGAFYPGRPAALRASVGRYLEESAVCDIPDLKALVVPHAGYPYSGPVAGSAYAALRPHRFRIRNVLLFGPSHRVYFKGLAAPEWTAFSTPLGDIPVDQAAVDAVRDLPHVQRSNAAHGDEHGLEVQLPFLQEVLESFHIVPWVVGDTSPEMVSGIMAALWNGPETLILVSTDLSHYHPYEAAVQLDRATAKAVVDGEPSKIGLDSACGRIPLQALLIEARRHGLGSRLLDLRNSGDTAGPRDAVVGYGAFAFS